ncbi:MAG: hypothetical protein ACTSUG_02530 [Candidatus Helarchaeota archaeon]
MIDVYDKIKPLLKFEKENDFYFLQVLKRKKDNPKIKSNGRLIKSYYIRSIEYLEKHYEEIKKLCDFFNARATLRLNVRNYKKVAEIFIQKNIYNYTINNYKQMSKSYSQAAGLNHSKRTFLIDIDDKDKHDIKEIKEVLKKVRPYEVEKIIIELPTKNGIHLITRSFDLRIFKLLYKKNIDIHKDNPINLYIPD